MSMLMPSSEESSSRLNLEIQQCQEYCCQQPGPGPRAVRAGHSFGRAEPLNWLLTNLAWLSNWVAPSGAEPAKPVKNSMLSPTLFHHLCALLLHGKRPISFRSSTYLVCWHSHRTQHAVHTRYMMLE